MDTPESVDTVVSEEPKFYVSVTAIIRKGDKVLITKRASDKKKWPNKWTVPGGRVSLDDFINKRPPDTEGNQWYHVLEDAVCREVKEETGLLINNIKYLCDLAIHDSIIISFTADYLSGEVQLQIEECDEYVWVTVEEASQYDLIEGIQDELEWMRDGIF